MVINPETNNVERIEQYKVIPYKSEKQRQRENRKHKANLVDVVKEVILFDIPTKNQDGEIASKKSDNAYVIDIMRELKRGGFKVKDGDIVDTVRQVKNTRHPDFIPITISVISGEIAKEILAAAAEIGLIGARDPRRGDKENGRIGFLRKSLSERERKNIRKRKEWRQTPQGQAHAEILRREENSRTDQEEWAKIKLEV